MPKNICHCCANCYQEDYCLVKEDYIDGECTENCEEFAEISECEDDYFKYFEKKLDKKLSKSEEDN